MRQANPAWKVLLAGLSLLLMVLVWAQGLMASFSRPSVTPTLSLHQQEMALLADPVMPLDIKPLIVGLDPESNLRKALRESPLDQITDRNKLVLAALEPKASDRDLLLENVPEEELLLIVRRALLNKGNNKQTISELKSVKDDPLLYQVSCFAIGGNENECIDDSVSKNMAYRLIISQIFPVFAVILGVGLLLSQIWLFLRSKTTSWPILIPLPLSLIDMILLIAGGFVFLGEVLLPTIVVPISSVLTNGLVSPVSDALKVFFGYTSMTVPPLVILNQQMKSLKSLETPLKGWLQWGLFPVGSAFLKAFRGWLMVMPLVLITGWLMNSLIGDQGGSNPLLELVLGSKNSMALFLLIITTVVVAPLFEEVVFRGVLLPVLAREFGLTWGVVISALVFALAHLSVGELPPLMVLGLGLALLRLSSGRLFPCVLMHSLWNGVTFVNLLLLGG